MAAHHVVESRDAELAVLDERPSGDDRVPGLTGPQRSQASTGSVSAPANGCPRAARPRGRRTRPAPARRARRVGRGTPPTRGSPVRGRRGPRTTAGRPAGGRGAARPVSSQSEAQSVEADPSHPIPTGTPASRKAFTGAMPPPPISMFELGQWATPVPHDAHPHHLGVVRVDAVGDPRPVAAPAAVLEVLDRPAAVHSRQYVSSSGSSARWVCNRTSSRSASSAVRRMSSGVTENGEHGASAIRTIAPAALSWWRATASSLAARIVVVVLHDRVGRQAAVLLRQRHRAPGRVEPEAQLLRRPDLGRSRSPPARRVDVEVVAGCRAAAQGELGEPDPRRHVRGLLVERRPAGVQRGQPVEQRPVGRRR